MRYKISTKEFIERARSVHGDRYDYSKVEYVKSSIPVTIICPDHGEFYPTPNNHISKGHLCPICAKDKLKYNILKKKSEDFISKSTLEHNNKYDYSKVDYKGNNIKVCIICPEHGEFWQRPSHHMNGHGCSKCAKDKLSNVFSLNKNIFIQRSKSIHGDRYDYSKVEYKNQYDKVVIICPNHGKFIQTAKYHMNGDGCPICNSSKGEQAIKVWLENNNIKFKQQKKFRQCRDKYSLPFDFYLPELNTCIEYDGEQHFKPIEYFGGEVSFKDRKRKDQIKTNYCKYNNIRLIRIRYDESIEGILNEYI